jgi:hypothetical protein
VLEERTILKEEETGRSGLHKLMSEVETFRGISSDVLPILTLFLFLLYHHIASTSPLYIPVPLFMVLTLYLA